MDSGKKKPSKEPTRSQIVSASAAEIARRFKLGDEDREWLEVQLRVVALNEAGACKRIALKHGPFANLAADYSALGLTVKSIADEIETRGSY